MHSEKQVKEIEDYFEQMPAFKLRLYVSALLEDRRELQQLLGENSQAEREVLDARASSSPADLREALLSTANTNKLVFPDQPCWCDMIKLDSQGKQGHTVECKRLRKVLTPVITVESPEVPATPDRSSKTVAELEAELAALRSQVDNAWSGISNSFEIEPRSYFEERYGEQALEIAVHYLWKRDKKVAALREQLAEAQKQLATPSRSSTLAKLELLLDEYGSCYFITEYDEHERLQNRTRIANRIIGLFGMASPSGRKGVE